MRRSDLTSKSAKDWPRKMGRSESKNEKDWLDLERWEGLTRKNEKTWLDLEKWEALTRKNEKIWVEKWEGLTSKVGRTDQKMRRSDSKNEKGWLRKVRRTDPEKWEGLSRKMRRTNFKKWEGLTGKVRRTESKYGRSHSKYGRSESKQGRPDSKTGRSDSNNEGLADTSQPSYIGIKYKKWKWSRSSHWEVARESAARQNFRNRKK